MENLIVGKPPLELNHLIKLILASSSSQTKLLQTWTTLAKASHVPATKVFQWMQKLETGNIDIRVVLLEILRSWVTSKASTGTLNELCRALVDCEMKDISELLESTFWLLAVKSVKIKLYGRIVELSKIIEHAPDSIYRIIYDQLKSNNYSQPIDLLKEAVIPNAVPNYYVQRKLYRTTQVDESIFKTIQNCKDVLLVKGIGIHVLAKLSEYQHIGTSGSQLDEDELTAQLMVLERDEHFELLCKRTENPVHLIQNINGAFFWAKSNKGLDTLRAFLKETESNHYCEDEQLMYNLVSKSSTAVLSITGSPGMGKTMLLQSIAKNVLANERSIVLFWNLNEFINDQRRFRRPNSALKAIKDHACATEVSKIIFNQMLNDSKVFLLLDKYDEVCKDKLKVAHTFLRITKKMQNFCTIVAARPYSRHDLENHLNTISYQMRPFNESEKPQFLLRYWVHMSCGVRTSKLLEKYANECLKAHHDRTADTKKEFTGIPFLCEILAKSFADGAAGILKTGVWSRPTSTSSNVFNTYRSLVDIKFKNIASESIYNAHIYESITALFPDWLKKFESHLDGFRLADSEAVYSIGLIEKPAIENKPRFIHQTVAEYLLAQYLAKYVNIHDECRELVFTSILGGDGFKKVISKRGPDTYVMKHPVITFFLNMHLKDKMSSQHSLMDSLALITFLYYYHADPNGQEVLCKVVEACVNNNLEILFDLFRKVYGLVISDLPEQLDILKTNYFKFLPHFATVSFDGNISLLRQVLKFTKETLKMDLSYHIYDTHNDEKIIYPWIPGSTPLHLAVYYGKLSIAAYLIHEYGKQLKDLKYLLHACLSNSSNNEDHVIEEKTVIVELLLKKAKEYNLNWLEEMFNERVPFLEENIHLKLLQTLVQTGVDINTFSKKYGTVLHTSCNISDYNDLVQFAFTQGFNLLSSSDDSGTTTLMCFVSRVYQSDSESIKTIELFGNAGVNFNAVDNNGDSVLFHALKNRSASVSLIEKIVDYGANVNHENFNKFNAAHFLMNLYNPKSTLYDEVQSSDVLTKLKLLIWTGFNLLNKANVEGQTPFDIVLNSIGYFKNPDLFVLFHSNGTDFNEHIDFIRSVHPSIHKEFYHLGLYIPPTQPELKNTVRSESTEIETYSAQVSSDLSPDVLDYITLPTNQNVIVPNTNALIGKGSFGKVYEGTFGDRTVAVKIMKVLKDEVKNVKLEIQNLINCDNHENIVRYFCENHKESKGQIKYLLAMELCESTLREYIEQKESSLKKLEVSVETTPIDILRQATEGVFHLHTLKEPIIHRDIKPENILLKDRNGRIVVKLADFGTSKVISQGNTHYTTKNFAGTVSWIAPELLNAILTNQACAHLTRKADIFSLGCIFYYVLSNGEHPFKKRAPSSKAEYEPKIEVQYLGGNTLYYGILRLMLFMISFNENDRPSIGDIKNHPTFWTADMRVLFFTESFDLSVTAELTKIENWLKRNHQKLAGEKYSNLNLIFSRNVNGYENGWINCLSDSVKNALPNKKAKKPTVYDGHSFVDLLQAMRNLKAHIREKDASVQQELWQSPEDFLNYWQSTNRFPFLSDFLWTAFQSAKNPMLQRFYDGINFNFTKVIKNENKFVL